ncbi:hypothetical protein [Nonomuraea sp. NPDC049758]|uniref:hypothetical protein n=1 Tax=Nonomuraea sp. NPDC049758 TaxID=3154360 RepID=UPI00342F899D
MLTSPFPLADLDVPQGQVDVVELRRGRLLRQRALLGEQGRDHPEELVADRRVVDFPADDLLDILQLFLRIDNANAVDDGSLSLQQYGQGADRDRRLRTGLGDYRAGRCADLQRQSAELRRVRDCPVRPVEGILQLSQ